MPHSVIQSFTHLKRNEKARKEIFRLVGLISLLVAASGQKTWNDRTNAAVLLLVPPSEKEARLEMLGRDLISDLHLIIEASVTLENVLQDERWRVWSTGATM